MKKIFTPLFAFICITLNGQNTMNDSLPYTTIPDAPEMITPGSVVSRMIDGLGFRYYWATEGLTPNELEYQPGNDSRTIAETMDHVYNLSLTILRSAQKRARHASEKKLPMDNDEKRKKTLENLAEASTLFKKTDNLSEHKIISQRPKGTSEFPIWNQINGPIEDAVWHAGQITMLRRIAGNPINPKVNVFLGKLND